MNFRIRAFLSFLLISILSGCSNLDVNENAWATCSVSGTAIIALASVSVGGSLATGTILGGTNSSIGCFFVYQRDGFNTGVDSFADIRIAKAESKARQKADKTGQTGSSTKNQAVAGIAMPVVPSLPVIPVMPTFDDIDTESVPAMPILDNTLIDIPSVASVFDNVSVEETDSEDIATNVLTVKDQTLVFDGTIGSKNEPLYVFFTGSSLEVDIQGKEHIQMLANWMLANPGAEVELIGHSDNSGTASYNLQLSLQRAEEVMKILTDSGVDEFRVLMDYRGAEQPAQENNTDENRDLNRRVEVIWH